MSKQNKTWVCNSITQTPTKAIIELSPEFGLDFFGASLKIDAPAGSNNPFVVGGHYQLIVCEKAVTINPNEYEEFGQVFVALKQ